MLTSTNTRKVISTHQQIRVINTSDMNAYMDRKGNISADGLVRVKRALFALAYGDENLISKMAESVDDEIKNVSTALMNAAPTVARANLLMRNGQRKKMDIAKTITDAIKKYEHLKKTNMPVQGYLDSTSLFDDISDASKDILAFLDRNKRKVRAIADMMKNLATNIINSDNPQEGSLFGGAAVKNPTLKDYVETAIKQAEIRDNPNEGILIFEAPQEKAKKSDAVKWIESHPFKYDKSKSVDENIARGEAYLKTYIDKFGTTDQIDTPERQALREQKAKHGLLLAFLRRASQPFQTR